MATKASGTLVLIIEKQHASWDLMVTALPALEVHFRCQLRIASARKDWYGARKSYLFATPHLTGPGAQILSRASSHDGL